MSTALVSYQAWYRRRDSTLISSGIELQTIANVAFVGELVVKCDALKLVQQCGAGGHANKLTVKSNTGDLDVVTASRSGAAAKRLRRYWEGGKHGRFEYAQHPGSALASGLICRLSSASAVCRCAC